MPWTLEKSAYHEAVYFGEFRAATAQGRPSFSGWVDVANRTMMCSEYSLFDEVAEAHKTYRGKYRLSTFERGKWLIQRDGEQGYVPMDVEVEEFIREAERLFVHDVIEGCFD